MHHVIRHLEAAHGALARTPEIDDVDWLDGKNLATAILAELDSLKTPLKYVAGMGFGRAPSDKD